MLKIAIPNKGRLFDKTISLLSEAGFKFDISERQLFAPIFNFPMEILFVRADDIPTYIYSGIVDLGITGQDLVAEEEVDIQQLLPLGYGKASMVVAAPEGTIDSIEDLKNKGTIRIATSFKNITKRFFEDINIKYEIADIHGAVEITPRLGLSDVIVDITSTGTTLRMNKLKIIHKIMDSQATLFANKNSLKEKEEDINIVVNALKSVLDAHKRKYLMANIPKNNIEKAKEIVPGITAPTVLSLYSTEDMVAIHAVVNEDEINHIVNSLKKIGATGILILNIERIFE